MLETEKNIYVFDSFSFDVPILMGTLYSSTIRGQEKYSFSFDDEWLNKTRASVILDPDLKPISGRQYPTGEDIFGVFKDSSPDRWGRMLMNRRERFLADRDNRKPRKLNDVDYLIGVDDETRMGGLRFKLDIDGPFMSDDKQAPVPPWERLRTLEEASRIYENNESTNTHLWLETLLKPGSSLGGARPKATVIDESGQLWIAKFPSKHDENDVGAWEMVVHELAKMCGLNVPESRLERFSDFGSTYLVKRFDRINQKRIHYASAMTLLNKKDGSSAYDGSSYMDIVSLIKANGSQPKDDLIELWKRIAFYMSVSNTDDHLRNHAFILTDKGWKLSPMFDVNPVPYGNELSLNISDDDNRIDGKLLISTGLKYGLSENEANEIFKDIVGIVKDNWVKLAKQYDLSNNQIENMKPAFLLDYD